MVVWRLPSIFDAAVEDGVILPGNPPRSSSGEPPGRGDGEGGSRSSRAEGRRHPAASLRARYRLMPRAGGRDGAAQMEMSGPWWRPTTSTRRESGRGPVARQPSKAVAASCTSGPLKAAPCRRRRSAPGLAGCPSSLQEARPPSFPPVAVTRLPWYEAGQARCTASDYETVRLVLTRPDGTR